MSLRRFSPVLPFLLFVAAGITPVRTFPEPARVVVQNGTYSSLQISVADETGRESSLGQAPPEFTNTLLIREPLPQGTVRLIARLVGESEVLYRSTPVRLSPGARLVWRLPENQLER